jgi:hypothetical protein
LRGTRFLVLYRYPGTKQLNEVRNGLRIESFRLFFADWYWIGYFERE